MAYKRNYVKKPMYSKNKNNVMVRVKKLEKKVKRIDPEVKHHHRDPDNIAFPNYTGAVLNLAAVDQGITPITRIGNQIRAIRITVRYAIYIQPGNNSQGCRVIFFVDNANTLTTPAQILKIVGTVNSTNSYYNDEERANFKILSDKRYALVAFGGAPSGIEATFDKKLDMPIHFEDTTSTVYKNMVKALIISDVSTSVCTFNATYDLSFTDC